MGDQDVRGAIGAFDRQVVREMPRTPRWLLLVMSRTGATWRRAHRSFAIVLSRWTLNTGHRDAVEGHVRILGVQTGATAAIGPLVVVERHHHVC